ncbi:unnamed protein product [Microthlaspi erraticum]|uniref:MULE transposase domain-containing protein n=1 Tax=Microthlaspi erraticum TaxID=1685480 RepID=A0A6D2KIF7_9BRAS|nr:unnamed protein product [Microthlaspi erraticum]
MVYIAAVYGKWEKREQGTWFFVVDDDKGGRLFSLRDGCTHGELVEMAKDEYGVDTNSELMEVSYPLPPDMLQGVPMDSPPTFVTTDRQVQVLANEYDDADDEPVDEPRPTTDWTNGEIDEAEADYSEYGRVPDEDVREKKVPLDDIRLKGRCYNEGGHFDKYRDAVIKVGQRFASKDELLNMCRLMAVVHRFSFRVFKSSPALFVATCNVNGYRVANRKSCTPKYIGALFIERVGIIEGIVPEHIVISMKVMFGLKLNYTTAYRSLRAAHEYVRGTPEDGYANLASYLHRTKEANPGTITDLVRDKLDRFKYCFISFRACMVGFQYCRRVVIVDGTHLTGKYGGTLLVAAGQMGCFTQDFPLVIVSDRHPAIANAIETVFPWATRGICYYHMQNNIIGTYHAKDIMYMVKGAAYAHNLDTYNWERFNIKTSNIAESINSAVKKAKEYPLPSLLEFIREKLSHWFMKRRENALTLTTLHSKGVEYLLAVDVFGAYGEEGPEVMIGDGPEGDRIDTKILLINLAPLLEALTSRIHQLEHKGGTASSSRTQGQLPEEPPVQEKEKAPEEVQKKKKAPAFVPPPYKPQLPFPVRFKKQQLEKARALFDKQIKEIDITMPFLDACMLIPPYQKFLKDAVTERRKEVQGMVVLSQECSAIITRKVVGKKFEDPAVSLFLVLLVLWHSTEACVILEQAYL